MRTESVTRVIATTHEINLKGGNRRWFEKKLNSNLRHALSDLPLARLQRPSWRVLLSFTEPVPFREVARRLGTVFGINSFMAVQHAGHTLDEVNASLDSWLPSLSPASFAVRCQRSDKRFPLTSIEIERQVGAHVVEQAGWRVNLGDPALTVHLLLDTNGFWCWLESIKGPGGLPVGCSGRAACLLSGGIDSPVAAYLMLKRGMSLDLIHFHSVPQTDAASIEKVEELVQVLNRYQRSARLAKVPLLPIQEQIVAHCPAELRVLLYRRAMLRIAEQLARRLRSRALITGESLGQVASQTIDNLAAVETVARMPVLRPLIGLDKAEIIALARRAGTYEISILPHFDCCSFLLPEHPATRASAGELDRAEQSLAVNELVAAALEGTEIASINQAADWQDIPVPNGVTA